ncbi:MAG: DUF4249 family protein [Bacteroidetes bacterium]|nr:DUF4249 family protein [Bacteroidota bacterium]
MKIKHLAIVPFLGFLSSGCIDEIKLDIDTNQQKVVVNGLVSDSLQVQTVQLGYSAVIGVGNDNILTPIEGASVLVKDDAGSSFQFLEAEKGIYEKEFQGESGKVYHLEIQLPDGKQIRSVPALLRKAPEISDAKFEIVEESYLTPNGNEEKNKLLQVSLNTNLSNLSERPYLLWRTTGEYEFWEGGGLTINPKVCYVKNNVALNVIKVLDTHKMASGHLIDEPFLRTDYNYRFSDRYCFHLQQYAISASEYKYWQAVDAVIHIDGSMFDPPPGTVKGNLFNPDDSLELVVGYFTVAGVSYKRAFTDASSIGTFVSRKCESLNGGGRGTECAYCLSIVNSTTQKPSYWP